jgi:hypothetical protein
VEAQIEVSFSDEVFVFGAGSIEDRGSVSSFRGAAIRGGGFVDYGVGRHAAAAAIGGYGGRRGLFLLGRLGDRLFRLLWFFVILVSRDSVLVRGGSCKVSVIGSSWARGGRTLVEIGSESIVFLKFNMKEMRVFGSTNEIRVSVFLGKDLVFFSWF